MSRNTVGARELKARLGKYLRTVRAGKTLIVTDRGEPVAELRPIQDDMERRLAKLRAAGRISGGSGQLKPFKLIVVQGVSLSEAILEDREDRF
ncbi:MAG: type II toxin-antitoxin system prevent-host-death family antitoxin [Acidobacteriota bacterium]|nr:type II toxin-antitoxin system prevent-host-death family antitoxin [Acidobacteriota bacterium]